MTVAGLSRAQLAAVIVQTLAEQGVDVVLTGGSCASIYTSERFASLDLDFIDLSYARREKIASALAEIGFSAKGKRSRYFEHPDSEWTIEFPSAPLMVGDEPVSSDRIGTWPTDCGDVRLLEPTDCVKDRLANFYHFGDRQCWEQAVMVAKSHPVDWRSLEVWHKREGVADSYPDFRSAVTV